MAADPHDLHTRRNAPSGNAGEFMGVGVQFAGAILLFLFAGRWLDERLGTSPWMVMLGVFVGFGLGFFSMYRQMVIMPRERERRRHEEQGQ
ncbi:MAG: AtpZ/AtpI family protein [Gemmatimonadota bacterium]|jgi:F0F1-type ATP synthase assembly protein I|nr:AtpZ/AtpI family protein [Gemmatimonadota bacterium]